MTYESHVTENNDSLERILAGERRCTEGGRFPPHHGSVWQLVRNLIRIPEEQNGYYEIIIH